MSDNKGGIGVFGIAMGVFIGLTWFMHPLLGLVGHLSRSYLINTFEPLSG
jgi:hypothetical protein